MKQGKAIFFVIIKTKNVSNPCYTSLLKTFSTAFLITV